MAKTNILIKKRIIIHVSYLFYFTLLNSLRPILLLVKARLRDEYNLNYINFTFLFISLNIIKTIKYKNH